MTTSDLKFGTSGLRGLVTELNGPPAFDYTLAFLAMLVERGELKPRSPVCVGRDLRASSPSISEFVFGAARHAGFEPLDCGSLPTPALALYASARRSPAVMVTGSHIPDDRNGLKFYRASGEIDKKDEADIIARHAGLANLSTATTYSSATAAIDALAAYKARYLDYFGPKSLSGLRVGVYQHSSVARDLLVEMLSLMGAKATPLGRSDQFVPVDTEALRPDDMALLNAWAEDGRYDAIVSTDGDADRPLMTDERGGFLRGDLVGAITAGGLGADCIVTPVTSNSALETCAGAPRVVRTKVGSPFVIEGMNAATAGGAALVVGFEANGGVLLGSTLRGKKSLPALPTRDAMLPILCVLTEVRKRGARLSKIAAGFGFRATSSGRLENVAPDRSRQFLSRLAENRAYADALFSELGGIAAVDMLDGIRLFAATGEIVHFRASGNAPELRCYVEADRERRANDLLVWGLELARRQTEEPGEFS